MLSWVMLSSHLASGSNEKGYIMKDFPKGYEFYDHHKGPPEKIRHDLYLYGKCP